MPEKINHRLRIFDALKSQRRKESDEKSEILVGEKSFRPIDVSHRVDQYFVVRSFLVELAEQVVRQNSMAEMNEAAI